ncbi:hypothetical protein DFQ28_003900 [Apophysomyces sp. BC1034]|nr:hypothetical protein DFQ30_001406 [Apophysomyces sp. BC1015]KAG0180913.1 hypothetical protein DFQ29_009852 [Apophysomyces sp. BC1021]KAG0189102.1 hypothetical protein DFQ28_003900 [Apophysomyces sp. BC1034]
MKQRFNALDIRATVSNLRERLIGIRLQNIYDVNAKTFLFKFANPDNKELVLIESGTRIHTTQFTREKSTMPSQFCSKLRKCLRTRRLTNVRQLGVDRIVDFEFAGGERSLGFHIIAEFYASGNIILTDQDYRILAILRVVQASETLSMAVGEIYNIQSALHDFSSVHMDKLQEVLRKAGPKDILKKVLNTAFDYGPAMTEHIILDAQLNPNMKVASEFDSAEGSPMLRDLFDAFGRGDELVASTAIAVPKGYIVLMDESRQPKKEGATKLDIYDEFHPFLYKQHASREYKEFETFDSAVDEFFSAIEAQKLELKARNQEEAAMKKIEAVRREQEGRVEGLIHQQITNVRKAELIEYNLQLVDAAITIIRNAVASQMDWQDLKELVNEEKKRENPIALIIDSLKLETNQITLLMTNPDEIAEDSEDSETDEEQSEPSIVKVDVDIGLTAFANARKYYDQKKSTAHKHEKTIAASSKALKSAERKIKRDLKETKITANINKIRKSYWFEKFIWFISTEGHLVIAGRDMQQNEILVKRYLQKDDVYVHADLHGAASVIVKNKAQAAGQPIPPSTLFQAGIMSVCQSKAWEAKIVTSAYWVYPDQVSKSAPTGEYLTTGSFMIRGKKNFLPPVQLVYGFGYLFKLDESSVGNHIGEGRHLEIEEMGGKQSAKDIEQLIDEDDAVNSISTDETDAAAAVPHENEETPAQGSKEIVSESRDEKATENDDKKSDTESTASDSDSDSSDDDDDNDAFPDTQLESTTVGSTAEGTSWKKYDLEEYGEEEELPEFARSQAPSDAQKKRFITAKERRQLKKGPSADGESKPANSETTHKGKKSEKSNEKDIKQIPVPTRGRKGKAKKIKEKYADQDEEERQLRMELLGSNKGPQPKGKKAKKEAKEKAEKLAITKQREQQKELREAQAKQELAKQEEITSDNEDDIKIEETDEKEKEVIRQMLKEENITMLEADEAANLSVLDSLTANPLPEDIIHFAIPVCAPYTALQKYKYKVKLTPGTQKRGKAIKQAHSVFLNAQNITAREKELIKCVPDMEAINTMMSKVKVSAPNLEASKRKKGKSSK